ncbi:carboxypeptidase-like regulatory domain-containing protein [Nocardioides daeguensis]|uniref:Alpha-amylase n=1 Tax=Nocardioides daeguensis TaxID=908359 RepID=A0ABP6UZ18_9ACTN|nr:carboxypeptidase-like regulatory domain-containing protein [Nocardioides daeguensis]MBV6728809.1 carboxypeptidase-like regulatory domain-containing protein [Nocardioides daeguensis]MCR1773581.1 carboxypeptidase-like regulatory domain-containing protein [Nocardioides daeguensis]
MGLAQHRLRPTLAAVLLLAVGVAGSPISPVAATTTPDERVVTGTVQFADGTPVEGALVNALTAGEVPELGTEDPDRRARTDAAGRFTLVRPDASFLVQICQPHPDAPEYCQETVLGVDHVITYVGAAGQVTDSWVTQRRLIGTTQNTLDLGTVSVRTGGDIEGTVVGGAGRPIRVLRLNGTTAFTVWADDEGRYRFEDLVPGRYRVAAGGEGTLPWRSPVVVVTADQSARVDGSLARGARISGTLVSQGRPVRHTDILVRRWGHGLVAATTTDEFGRFDVSGLVPGRYRVGILYAGGPFRRGGAGPDPGSWTR